MIVTTVNDGAAIVSSDYWGSEIEEAGKLFVSVNAGHIRVLMPRGSERQIQEMIRGVKHVVLSRGPWAAMQRADAVELLFEDGSDTPFALQLSPESFDMLPAAPVEGREWKVAVWRQPKERPLRVAVLDCHYRQAALPCLKPWKGRPK